MWIWRDHSKNFVKWSCKLLLAGCYIAFVFLAGFWALGYGSFTRYILVALFFACIFKSFLSLKKSIKEKLNWKQLALCLACLIVVYFLGEGIKMTLKGINCSEKSVNMSFPLKNGIYCIVQGGDDLAINHHYEVSAQRYALDIVKLNKLGLRANGLTPKKLNDYNIFNATV